MMLCIRVPVCSDYSIDMYFIAYVMLPEFIVSFLSSRQHMHSKQVAYLLCRHIISTKNITHMAAQHASYIIGSAVRRFSLIKHSS